MGTIQLLLAFVFSFIFNWDVPDRKFWLSTAFVFFLAVQVSTMAHFVPEQEGLIANAGTLAPAALKSRAMRWLALNYFRNAAGVLAYVFLLLAVLVPRIQ